MLQLMSFMWFFSPLQRQSMITMAMAMVIRPMTTRL